METVNVKGCDSSKCTKYWKTQSQNFSSSINNGPEQSAKT